MYHVHDEAYEYFTYDGARHFSPGSIDDAPPHTISLYSLSKAYGFASWRIGYMVIPAALFEAVNKIQDTILICPPAVSQHAAMAALAVGAGYCRGHLAGLARVRTHVLDAFRAIGDVCTVPRPDGAFYCLLRVSTALDANTLAERLIREHRVAAIPGTAFGLADGCRLRVSYGALDAETVAAGVGRLTEGLTAIVGGAAARRAQYGVPGSSPAPSAHAFCLSFHADDAPRHSRRSDASGSSRAARRAGR